MKRRVLVVSHEASRTGAPRVAVEVLRSLGPLDVRRIAVLRWDGPLKTEFRDCSEAVPLEPLRRARVLLRRNRRTRTVANRLEQIVAGLLIVRHWPDVVYLNTVKSACYVRPALLFRRPVVLHVHELEPLASQTLARYQLKKLYRRVRLVACSAEVRQNLSHITGVAPEDITITPSMIDSGRVECLSRLQPKLVHTYILIGACGTADHGKGVDQWLVMASLVRAKTKELGLDVRFLWIGQPGVEGLPDAVRRFGLEDVVEFTGEVANPYPLMAQVDVFTHPARQDAFPLVVLEAMVLARPVVAFDVGGLRSQVGDTGIIVAPGDAEAMAAAVIGLVADAASRRDLGARAAERARRLFSIERQHEATRLVVQGLLDG